MAHHRPWRLTLRWYLVLLFVGSLLMAGGTTVQRVRASHGAPASAAQMSSGPLPRQPMTAATVPDPAAPWVVGAMPLPLRPDGHGVVRSTPAVLADRRLPTVDRLPPPTSKSFQSTISPVPAEVLARSTWKPLCPVSDSKLRYLTMSFHGFDSRVHTGEMLVNADIAQTVVGVFKRLFAEGFPIEEMRITANAELNLPPTGDGNNTVGFLCHQTRGQTQWSENAYGLAIDLNPFNNPYVSGDLVVPELATSYLNRDWLRPGMTRGGDPAVTAFESVGWKWGGRWPGPVNFMHFSVNGR